MKILIVEDDRLQRMGLAKVLAFYDWLEVEQAKDGRDALEKLQQFPADVILTDNNMPVMNGPELIRSAKQVDPALRAILTGADSGDVSLFMLAKECGANLCMPKPIDCEKLIAVLRSWSGIEWHR